MRNTIAVVAAVLLITGEALAQAPTLDMRQPASAKSQPALSAQAINIHAAPGTVVRWSVPGTKRCAIGKRAWDALKETCYYPIDLEQKPAVVRVSRHGAGPAEYARLNVLPRTSVQEHIVLGDIPQANPSPAQLQRNAREQAVVAKLWTKREGPARFTLPLAPPAKAFPEGRGFGTTWVFNRPPGASELHSGADYAMAAGTPVAAVADGTVVIADDLFFAGNAVFIDHGAGLITMYFHLRDRRVKAGQTVKQGQSIGVVGSKGASRDRTSTWAPAGTALVSIPHFCSATQQRSRLLVPDQHCSIKRLRSRDATTLSEYERKCRLPILGRSDADEGDGRNEEWSVRRYPMLAARCSELPMSELATPAEHSW